MAASARVRIKQHPTDVWSTRERLSLACSVMRSGDQNWVSVSRAIRQFGDASRPSDWFSQKNCALQYSDLLEKVETPKRKRGEREVTETPGIVIVRKLTIERIEELKQIVQEEQAKYQKLKQEVEDTRSGALDDELQNVITEMEAEKAAKEEAERTETEKIASRRSPVKKPAALSIKTEVDDSTQDSTLSDAVTEDESNLSTAPSACNTPQPVVEEVRSEPQPLPTPTPTPPPPEPPKQSPKQSILEKALQEPPKEEIVETKDIIPTVEIKEEPIEVITTVPDVEIKVKVEVEEEPPATPSEDRATRSTSRQDSGGSLTAGVPTLTRLLGKPPATAPLNAQSPSANQSPAPKTKSPAANQSPVSKVKSQASKSPLAKSKVAQSPVAKSKAADGVTESPITTRSASVSEPADVEKKDVRLRERTPSRDRKKKEQEKEEIEEKVPVAVEIKEEPVTDTETVPLTPTVEFEEPPSPASSVVSNESGSFLSGYRGRRSRGGKRGGRGRGRRSTRVTRSKLTVGEDKNEEDVMSKQSEVETTDDDGDGGETGEGVLESDDTGSNVTLTRPHHYSVSESQPNSPAGSLTQGSDTEDEKAHKIWKKSIMLVWRAAANHKYANVFLHPVTDDIAPGYSSVVSRPMDLQTIKKSIEAGVIRTTAEFQRDMMLMFTNAIMYNNSDHDVSNMATEMYDDVMAQLEQFINTQMMVQVEPKLLRTLRRSDPYSDKEDSLGDSKRKRLSVGPETPDHHGGKAKKRKP